MIFSNPVQGPRIIPFGEPRLPTDSLPNGHQAFKVTQRFGDEFTQYGPHTGMDLGNFSCGDHVVAMEAGNAYAGVDGAGALHVIIDHGDGWKTLYWHLSAWVTVRRGEWVRVSKGQQIGLVGATGLGSGCHLHVEVHYNGVKKDPWVFLAQNQERRMLPVDAGYLAEGSVGPGVRLRVKDNTVNGSRTTTAETPVKVLAIRRDKTSYTVTVNGANKTDNDWYVVMLSDGTVWETAKLLVHGIAPTSYLFSVVPLPPTDCAAYENKINRAVTALEGVVRAVEAGLSALRAAIAALKG